MNKEMYVSSTPHETRLAMSEDGEIAEVYYEREKEYSLAGSIYKGRVTRVLPGMQSAFVDIGLERDAFLYVSDFFEDSEEYDRVVSEAEIAAAGLDRPVAEGTVPAGGAPAEPAPSGERDDRRGRRGRHRGRRGGRSAIPEEKFARPGEPVEPQEQEPEPETTFEAASPAYEAAELTPAPNVAAAFVLPGESLAKYRNPHAAAPQTPPAPEPAHSETAPAPEVPPAMEPKPSAAPAVSPVAAAAALVLPGESLAKYRHARPAPKPKPESQPEAVHPPVLAEMEADGGEAGLHEAGLDEAFDALDEANTEEDQLQPDAPLAGEENAGDAADASED
ncbi:MAG: hypothetical protein ACRD1F_03020, partial [Terriglobales bacterium]